MKKLLSLFGAIGLIATSASGVTSCARQEVDPFVRIKGAKYLDNGVNDMYLDPKDDAYFIQLLKYTSTINLMCQLSDYSEGLSERAQTWQKQSWAEQVDEMLPLPAKRLVVTDWWMEGNDFQAILDDVKWHEAEVDVQNPPFPEHLTYRYQLEITQSLWDAFHVVTMVPKWVDESQK